jgi:hypothetical protein
MKTGLLSLNAAIALSVIAFLTGLARLMLDVRFVSEFADMMGNQPGQVALVMLGFIAFFGGWVWALLAAARGSRSGLIGALVCSLLLALGDGLTTILFFCPTPCPTVSPLGDIIIWANLISGLVATVALGLQLRQNRQRGIPLRGEVA